MLSFNLSYPRNNYDKAYGDINNGSESAHNQRLSDEAGQNKIGFNKIRLNKNYRLKLFGIFATSKIILTNRME